MSPREDTMAPSRRPTPGNMLLFVLGYVVLQAIVIVAVVIATHH